MIIYRVIETMDYNEPKEEWAEIAAFSTEAEAQAFAVSHYETQTKSEDRYNPATDCSCEMCAEGFRVRYYKDLVVDVEEVK